LTMLRRKIWQSQAGVCLFTWLKDHLLIEVSLSCRPR
jgi:hypothetical protein